MAVNLVSGGSDHGRSRYGRGSRRPINEINMTPFIDVVLVLLIVFMISAPMMTVGVAVDLPKAGAAALQDKKQPLEISITPRQLMLQDKAISLRDLPARLKAIAVENKDTAIHIRADKTLSYDQVMQVIGMVRQSGLTKLALITSPQSDAPAP